MKAIQDSLMATYRGGAGMPSAMLGGERELVLLALLREVLPPIYRFGQGAIELRADSRRSAPTAAPMSGKGSAQAPARYRRCADRAGERSRGAILLFTCRRGGRAREAACRMAVARGHSCAGPADRRWRRNWFAAHRRAGCTHQPGQRQ